MAAPIAYLLEVQGQAEAAGELDKFGGSLDKVDKTAQTTTSTTKQYSASVGQAALGITTAATAAASLYGQYDQLEKLELRITQTEKSRDQAVLTLSKSQEALDKLIASGTTTGLNYEQAVEKVRINEQNLQLQQEKLGQSQGDLTQGQLNFALSVLPTVMGAVSGVQTAMTALRTIQGLSSIAQAASIPVTVADTGAKSALAGATGAAAGATGGLSMAMRLLQIAMGPVGWIILGVGAFLAIFATNAFGVRDAINSMGKAIGDALPFLRPLLDTLAAIANTIFPQAEDKSKSMADGVTSDAAKLGEQFAMVGDDTTAMKDTVTGAFATTNVSSSADMDALAKNVDKNSDAMVADFARVEKAMKSVKGASSSGSKEVLSIGDPADTQKIIDRAKGKTTSDSGSSLGVASANFTITIKIGEKELRKVFGDVKDGGTIKFV